MERAIRIREMVSGDLAAVAKLEQESFSVPWSEKLLAEGLQNVFDRTWVLETEEPISGAAKIAGYCNLRVIAGEGELMRISVAKAFRRRGYARNLMEVLVGDARERQAEAITLEVRASNLSAVKLYKSYGFEIEAVRKQYYANPSEDALIMWKRRF